MKIFIICTYKPDEFIQRIMVIFLQMAAAAFPDYTLQNPNLLYSKYRPI